MNLQGIDLSSFGGDIGMDGAALPPLPQSPPLTQLEEQYLDTPKASTTTFGAKSRTASETEVKEPPRSQIRHAKDDDELRPNSSSMSKIYHLRKNPGSTPELSLVGSKENVRRQSTEGKSCEYSSYDVLVPSCLGCLMAGLTIELTSLHDF
jgi:hypothetical protein